MFQKYRSLAGFTFLVISATLFTGARITGSATGSTVAPAPVTVAPIASAEIPDSSGMRLSDVGVYKEDSLCFLMHHGGVAQLLRIDLSGDIKQIVDLGGDRPASVTRVSTSSDGQFAITRHNNEVELYSTDGSISKLGAVGKQSLGRAFVDGRLFEVTSNEIFASDDPV